MGTQSHWKPLYTKVPGTRPLTQSQGQGSSSCTACPWQCPPQNALAGSFPNTKAANQRQAVVRSKAWQHSSIWAVAPLPTSPGAQSYSCSCPAALAFPCLPEAGKAQQSQLFLLPLLSFQGNICLAGILALANQTNDLCHKALTTVKFLGME